MTLAMAVVLLGAIGMAIVGLLGLTGRLPPNHFAGIRTPFTRSTDENWYETHRRAGSVFILGSVAVIAAGVALLPFALAGALPETFVIVVVVAMAAVLLLTAVAAWIVGTRRARAQLS